MKRFIPVLHMLKRAASRLRRGKAPFTSRELVAGFSHRERDRFPELTRFPDDASAEKAWQQAADDTKRLWLSFGLIVAALLIFWFTVRGSLIQWVSPHVAIGWFSGLCLDVLVGSVVGVVGVVLAMRWRHRSVHKSLRRQLNELAQPTCLACGYNLTGNESGKCPECGLGTSA